MPKSHLKDRHSVPKLKRSPTQAEKSVVPTSGHRPTLPVPFVKVEKNLSSLGFFTASNVRIRGTTKKTVSFVRDVGGERIEAKAVILPSAEYGLPITADQDKFLAFQKILNEIRHQEGRVSNPIAFTSSDLLKILSYGDSGKNYEDVYDWVMRMVSTTVSSQGVVYLAGRKKWASDIFHVFEKAVLFGMEMPDGTIADKNYIWLSEWQLENINSNFLLPIDLDTYVKLRNHISKALVPLLQIWLYASRSAGQFEKRYTELCEILNIKRWPYLSRVRQILAPSLNELAKYGYLANWNIEPTSDKQDIKIIFWHGQKFRRDQKNRLSQKMQTPLPPEMRLRSSEPLVEQMVRRGIAEDVACQLISTAPSDQHLMDQLEWGDYVLAQAPRGKFHNPPGFFIYLIRENVTPPEDFETSRKQGLRWQAQEVKQRELQEQMRLQLAYEEYRSRVIDDHIRKQPKTSFQRKVDGKKRQLLKQNKSYELLPPKTITEIAESAVRAETARTLSIPSFEEFRRQNCQTQLPLDAQV
jgi:hypothetical protein